MFGMGGTEILVILIVALLFLGPEKLPQAAKTISKGIRDLKRQSRALQQQIEDDEQIGGAIRDLKSALRGDEAPIRPHPIKPHRPNALLAEGSVIAAASTHEASVAGDAAAAGDDVAAGGPGDGAAAGESGDHAAAGGSAALGGADDGDELRSMIRPAEGTVAKGSEPKHG